MIKKAIVFILITMLICTFVFAAGCSKKNENKNGPGSVQNTATVELEGNPTTGFTWICTIIPEGIVKEVSKDFMQNDADEGMTGVGGTFIFTFESIQPGEAELAFFYLREWEDEPAESIVVYNAVVDDSLGIALTLVDAGAGGDDGYATPVPPIGYVSFNVTEWLSDTDNAMQFQFIAINTGSGETEADETQKEFILDKLKNVVFDAVQSPGDVEWDFAFAMNEPYLFFSFLGGDSLFVKVPDSIGYFDFAAQLTEYPELSELYDFINEMR